jgi:hemoglobin
MPTLFEHAGAGRPDHVDHLTAFTAESFGGPDRFSRELGFAHLISVHRGLRITEEQRQRFVQLYMAALDTTGMPSDPAFREAVNDDELHPLREVPRWTWPGDDEGG